MGIYYRRFVRVKEGVDYPQRLPEPLPTIAGVTWGKRGECYHHSSNLVDRCDRRETDLPPARLVEVVAFTISCEKCGERVWEGEWFANEDVPSSSLCRACSLPICGYCGHQGKDVHYHTGTGEKNEFGEVEWAWTSRHCPSCHKAAVEQAAAMPQE